MRKNKLSPVVSSCFLLFMLFFNSCGTKEADQQQSSASGDSTRVLSLIDEALHCQSVDDLRCADSLSSLAVTLAAQSGSHRLILLTNNAYCEANELTVNAEKATLLVLQAHRISMAMGDRYWEWRSVKNLSRIFLENNDFQRAYLYATEALAMARQYRIDSLVPQSFCHLGLCLQSQYFLTDALQSYLNALYYAGQMKSDKELKNAYYRLADFFNSIGLYDDAIQYKKLERDLILGREPVDSSALMWNRYRLYEIEYNKTNPDLKDEEVLEVMSFAKRHGDEKLKFFGVTLYRSLFIKRKDIKGLFEFYHKKAPDELAALKRKDPEMFTRLQCYFLEYQGHSDSAQHIFQHSEELLLKSPFKNAFYTANFYKRYGEFLKRHGRHAMAIVRFTKAFHVLDKKEDIDSYKYRLAAASNLEELYRSAGDFYHAWYFSDAVNKINKKIELITNQAQVKNEELQLRKKQFNLNIEQQQQNIKTGKRQRNLFAAGLLFVGILAFSIYRNYASQKRLNQLLDSAKKKSDDLLSNILPHETAEELKQTGQAKARAFAEVTVMFTDFKDFTRTSERMEAEELVRKIDFYYSAFDRIIEKYGIEKIKIIGDGYMCAGGLPIPNETHAADIVGAGLELQQFALEQKEKCVRNNEIYFDLRVGIHTGPVVAGVVGLRKFAYDIWGDTVNTASRLESTGEPGKVNISGSTYEKIKHDFTCEYRGKISARNKGEIDMYFVTGRKKQQTIDHP